MDHGLRNRLFTLMVYSQTTCSNFSSRFYFVGSGCKRIFWTLMRKGIFIVMYSLDIGAVVSISIIPLSSYPLGLAVPSTNCAYFRYHVQKCRGMLLAPRAMHQYQLSVLRLWWHIDLRDPPARRSQPHNCDLHVGQLRVVPLALTWLRSAHEVVRAPEGIKKGSITPAVAQP